MNYRHAAALALMGWYLIIPPSAADLDNACNGKSILWSVVGSFSTQARLNSAAAACHEKSHRLAAEATPLSKWKLVSFETLEECQARREQDQKTPPDGRVTAKIEFQDEGNDSPSDDEVRSRTDSLNRFLKAQMAAEKCVAANDPGLKGD